MAVSLKAREVSRTSAKVMGEPVSKGEQRSSATKAEWVSCKGKVAAVMGARGLRARATRGAHQEPMCGQSRYHHLSCNPEPETGTDV